VNYRHEFHAGNFADCVKHALLVALLRALQRKPGPLFVLDTHAGAGHYDLRGERASRTNEAATGILRLLGGSPEGPRRGPVRARADALAVGRDTARIGGDVTTNIPGTATLHHATSAAGSVGVLEDYLARVRGLGLYPGSPELTRSLLRPDDRLACCELHPEELVSLRRLFRGDNQVAVHQRDGWEALKALLPPVQKRGLVLIDPPYEDHLEFAHLAQGLALARGRFGAGVLAAWYPIKNRARERAFFDALTLRDVIACEFTLREPVDPARLNGCGLLIVNPPYEFERQAQVILDTLMDRLGHGEPGQAALVTRLADE
jgi:23S rRNA (adenine2030-N6)-methyltransferase